MSTPALVLFDLDGVLIHYDHAARVETLATRTGATPAAVQSALFDSGLEAESDRGQWTVDGHVTEFGRRLGRPVTLDDCVRARAASMRVETAVLALANAVASRAEVAIFTNNGWLVREHLAQMTPELFPRFAGRVRCSAEFGLGKPDRRAFAACLASLAIAPAQTVFIDDKAENADGARAAGLTAHHYTNTAALARALAAAGLLEENDDAI